MTAKIIDFNIKGVNMKTYPVEETEGTDATIHKNKDLLDTVKDLEYFKISRSVIDGFIKSNLFKTFNNNCIAAADMIQASLSLRGINSKIVEVNLSLLRQKEAQNDYMFIGFDNINNSGQIDTHVVVVTDTEIPLLIDLSIARYLPAEAPFILRPLNLNNSDPDTVAEFEHFGIKMSYKYKKNIKYPQLHQKQLIQRMQDERDLKQSFALTKQLVLVAIVIGITNFVMNSGLLLLKVMFP